MTNEKVRFPWLWILALLTVFGLLWIGFLLYPVYLYHMAKRDFKKGRVESVIILASKPKKFKVFLERLFEEKKKKEMLQLLELIVMARQSDNDISELDAFSERGYVLYHYRPGRLVCD
jgi:hypothetical protein